MFTLRQQFEPMGHNKHERYCEPMRWHNLFARKREIAKRSTDWNVNSQLDIIQQTHFPNFSKQPNVETGSNPEIMCSRVVKANSNFKATNTTTNKSTGTTILNQRKCWLSLVENLIYSKPTHVFIVILHTSSIN